MKIETAAQFKTASEQWLSLERGLNEERFGPTSRRMDEARQMEIERAMAESPFEFDEDDNVVAKTTDTPIINDRIRML